MAKKIGFATKIPSIKYTKPSIIPAAPVPLALTPLLENNAVTPVNIRKNPTIYSAKNVKKLNAAIFPVKTIPNIIAKKANIRSAMPAAKFSLQTL